MQYYREFMFISNKLGLLENTEAAGLEKALQELEAVDLFICGINRAGKMN